jgi:hypothetical protein
MSSAGAARRAAVPISNARAEASRQNGAKSRGPKTPEGKARSARNALKHGMLAQKYVVLPQEDADEFAGLEAALTLELAPVGALQTVLARRVAVAAWRLARADRLEAEVFAERGYGAAGPGLALIRDGNGTRSFETLLRYRGAAMAEFWRALKTLKALQAEQAAETGPTLEARPAPRPVRPAARPPLARHQRPDEPERATEPRLEYVLSEPPAVGCSLHEPAACWRPNEPERQPAGPVHARADAVAPNEPRSHAQPPARGTVGSHRWSAPVAAAPEGFRADLRASGARGGPRSAPGAR